MQTNRIRVLSVLLMGLLLAHTLPAIAQKKLPTRPDALLKQLEAIQTRNNIAAVGLALVENGQITYSGGLGTLGHNNPTAITGDTHFRLGSITKTFTALAALKLAEDNKLDLNAPIRTWVPADWYQNPWQQKAPITLAHLLEHTAGFKDITKTEFDFNEDDFPPLSQTLNQFKQSHKAHWQPGLHSSYSNLGAGFAGFIIEQASQQPFQDYIASVITAPLNMNNTGFAVPAKKNFALGYNTDGVSPIPYWHTVYRPFGGINSTPNDMAQLLLFLLGSEQIEQPPLNSSSLARMETPKTTLAAQQGLTFGYGLGNYTWLRDGVLFHGHGGDADGYLSKLGYSHTTKSGYFLVSTAYNNRALRTMQKRVEQYLIDKAFSTNKALNNEKGLNKPTSQLPIIKLTSKQIDKLTGEYQTVTSRFGNPGRTAKIIAENNHLFTVIGGKKQKLIPVTNTHFRRKGETLATSAFITLANGEVYFQDDDTNLKKVSD